MLYVVVVLVVAVISVLLVMFSPAPLQFTVAGYVPLLGGRSIGTSLWLVVAGCALAGALLTWLAGLNQARALTRRVKKLDATVRRAKEVLAEKNATIAQYEEQLIELGVLERPEEEAPPEEEVAEPLPQESSAAESEAAAPEEEQ